MKLILLIIALPTWLMALGGIQSAPPLPTEEGSDLGTNTGFETGDATGWTADGCISIQSSVQRSGTYAAQATTCGAGAVTILYQNVTLSAAVPNVAVRAWVRGSAGADGSVVLQIRDTTHGGGFTQSDVIRQVEDADPTSTDWMQIYEEQIVNADIHGGDSYRFSLILTGNTTGSWYVDDFEIVETWYPVRTFVKYPSYKGMLWQDYDPVYPSGCDANEVCGVSTVIPPSGTALGDTKLVLTLATAAGCGSGVLTTDTTNPVTATDQTWEISGSSMVVDTNYFLCTELQLTSDSSVIADYPDWKVIKKTTTYRDALKNYIDDEGRWWHNGVSRFPWGTYTRYSGTYACSTCLWTTSACGTSPAQSTTKDCYIYDIQGFDQFNISPKADVLDGRGVRLASHTAAKHSVIVGGFGTFSAVNPTGGSDSLTPWLDALSDFEVSHLQTVNNWYGYALSETNSSQAPSAPSLSDFSSGGSIDSSTDPYVYVKIVARRARPAVKASADPTHTEASSSSHVGPLSGSTNRVEVTMPACDTDIELGYFVYADTNTSEAEPSNYTRQSNSIIACAATYNLTAVIDSQLAPPGSDTTIGSSRPSWIGATADTSAWTTLTGTASGHAGAAGYYPCDECITRSKGWVHRISKQLSEEDPGALTFGVISDHPNAVRYYRDILDVPSIDAYPYGQAGGPDQNWAGDVNRNATVFSSSGPNQTTTETLGSVNRIDLWCGQAVERAFDSRPNWCVVQQWNRNNTIGIPYAELSRQVWKAVIANQERGMIGGVLTWGWVSASGLENHVFVRGHTEAFNAHLQVGGELMGIESVLLETVDDSGYLATGNILSSVSSTLSLPSGTCDGYSSPVRWAAKEMPNGDQWILATNLCVDSQTITFTLSNPPASAVAVDYFSGETYTITANAFDVSSSDQAVHVIHVLTPYASRTSKRKE